MIMTMKIVMMVVMMMMTMITMMMMLVMIMMMTMMMVITFKYNYQNLKNLLTGYMITCALFTRKIITFLE